MMSPEAVEQAVEDDPLPDELLSEPKLEVVTSE
jgi:hypothetical protein